MTAATPGNPYAAVLRKAGLCATSARLAVLRLAPVVLREQGRLEPRLLHETVIGHGYSVSIGTIYSVLRQLFEAGLLEENAGDNQRAAALRRAGIQVSSARIAILRLAPEVLREHGTLDPRELQAVARQRGWSLSIPAIRRIVELLADAGLLAADAGDCAKRRRRGKSSPGRARRKDSRVDAETMCRE